MMYSIFLKWQETIPCMQFLGSIVQNENIKQQTMAKFQAYADLAKQKILREAFNTQPLSMHKVMS
ncbi:hypothetical protein BSR55_10390 [Acinetobacter bereziniae]|nr:hypothetical protein BSR55_10390 [Acinetobacter bereziniae]